MSTNEHGTCVNFAVRHREIEKALRHTQMLTGFFKLGRLKYALLQFKIEFDLRLILWFFIFFDLGFNGVHEVMISAYLARRCS